MEATAVLTWLLQKFIEAIKDAVLKLFKWFLQFLWKVLLVLIKTIIEFFKSLFL